jgi:hypothetical protein
MEEEEPELFHLTDIAQALPWLLARREKMGIFNQLITIPNAV